MVSYVVSTKITIFIYLCLFPNIMGYMVIK